MTTASLPTCLIVDDNIIARITLRQILDKIGKTHILGECEDAFTAGEFIRQNPVDILLLDVELPGLSGLELIRLLPQKPLTILITAKEGYAVEAFELNVVDYLVKPFVLSRVMLALQRAEQLLQHNHSAPKPEPPTGDCLFVKDNKVIRKINFEDILWMEAKGDYVQIRVGEKNYMIHGSLKTFEDKIPSDKFIRVHRSYIIGINKIDYIEDKIVYIKRQAIPISESYREKLLTQLRLL